MVIGCLAVVLQSPLPAFCEMMGYITYDDSFKVTLRARVEFSDLSFEDKLWTCYLHACIKFIQGEHMTNASLRNRFALEDHSAASVSRIIKSCVAASFVKALDPTAAPKYMKYVPYWA